MRPAVFKLLPRLWAEIYNLSPVILLRSRWCWLHRPRLLHRSRLEQATPMRPAVFKLLPRLWARLLWAVLLHRNLLRAPRLSAISPRWVCLLAPPQVMWLHSLVYL